MLVLSSLVARKSRISFKKFEQKRENFCRLRYAGSNPATSVKMLIEEIEKIKKKVVIVEGKKDKICLENFGVEKIITLSGIGLFEIVDKLPKCKEVVLLTDLDKKGKELYSRLRNILIKNGYKIDNNFRNYLFRETKIRQIEGLKKLVNS